MNGKLRILILEDSRADADLMRRQLRKGGMSFVARRVENRDNFVKQLDEFRPDLILADYSLPSWNGPAALDVIRQRSPEIPFIFVSGVIGDESAVETVKLGATDYLLKDRLSRLPLAVDRAIREVAECAERLRLEEQLRQSQKLEAIGLLAGGIAHDFNNMLTAVIGFSNLLRDKLDPADPLHIYAEEISKAGHRAAELTSKLLAFSRRQVLHPEVLDLNVIVADMDGLLRRLIGEDMDLVSVQAPDLGRVEADRSQIEQVILNLAINARDAMPDGGKLTIETGNVDLDEAYAREHVAVQPGPYVMLAVSDTGCGMDRDTQAHIFEPFFTTKEAGKGTGLGLATVYGIVKQSGGNIWVYSEPGRGTTFKIYLPRIEHALASSPPQERRPLPERGSETILLVEDEEGVRSLAGQVLRANGHSVLEASSAEEALLACERHDGPIDLLLTDVVMPGMGGRELAERLTVLRPDTKVLYMSGYTDDVAVRHGVLQAEMAYLEKPFTPNALVRKIRDVLGPNDR